MNAYCGIDWAENHHGPGPGSHRDSPRVTRIEPAGHRPRRICHQPHATAPYRDRHTVSRKKSDAQDAAVLANILRTDRHEHRPMPADSELARGITASCPCSFELRKRWSGIPAQSWRHTAVTMLL